MSSALLAFLRRAADQDRGLHEDCIARPSTGLAHPASARERTEIKRFVQPPSTNSTHSTGVAGGSACAYCGDALSGVSTLLADGNRAHESCAERWLSKTPAELVGPIIADAVDSGVQFWIDEEGRFVTAVPAGLSRERRDELAEWGLMIEFTVRAACANAGTK